MCIYVYMHILIAIIDWRTDASMTSPLTTFCSFIL